MPSIKFYSDQPLALFLLILFIELNDIFSERGFSNLAGCCEVANECLSDDLYHAENEKHHS
jgi:hypothetical protein